MAGTFKHPTPEDWLQPDPTSMIFGEFDRRTGVQSAISGERWTEILLGVSVSPEVPEEVRDMWTIARGILLYGWFFYPLYAVGDRELHRVADAAALHRYPQADGPRTQNGHWPTLQRRIEWLIKRGIIRREAAGRWDAIRQLRNEGTHADFAHIATPLDAVQSLEILRDEIDALFASETSLGMGPDV